MRNDWYQFRLATLSPAAATALSSWAARQPVPPTREFIELWWRQNAAARQMTVEELLKEAREQIDKPWRPAPPPLLTATTALALLAPAVTRKLRLAFDLEGPADPLDQLLDAKRLCDDLDYEPTTARALLEEIKADIDEPEWGATLTEILPRAVRAAVRPRAGLAVARQLRCPEDAVIEYLTRTTARRAKAKPGAGSGDFLDQPVDYVTLTAVRGALGHLRAEAVGAASRALTRAKEELPQEGELRDLQTAFAWFAEGAYRSAMNHLGEGDSTEAKRWREALEEPMALPAAVLSGFQPRSGPLAETARAGFPVPVEPLPEGSEIRLHPSPEDWVEEAFEDLPTDRL